MNNKVTNIYIDTSSFCDEDVKERVCKALDDIVEYNDVDFASPSKLFDIFDDKVGIFFTDRGLWRPCYNDNPVLSELKQVGLEELESIALHCKGVEEPLSVHNVVIKDPRAAAFLQAICLF